MSNGVSWVSLDISFVQQHFPDLQPTALSREGGATAYRLRLPKFKPGREFGWAELRLPKGFPDRAKAEITLSPDAVLRVPHLDKAGVLCTEGDPGPSQGHSPEDRILLLLQAYQEQFLAPWLAGELDRDFEAESLNYWAIEVDRVRSKSDPVRAVWTVDSSPARATVRKGLLLLPSRIAIAADEQLPITNRVIQSMGKGASQRSGLLVADIPISHSLTPDTWPRSASDLYQILYGRLDPAEYEMFRSTNSRRGRGVHRVVLLRTTEIAFAYLLPGGPPTVVDEGKRKKTYPPMLRHLPLNTDRIDPAWTVGRDQHPEVVGRQGTHVLILGAGALGSVVIDHLAKAGVGFISVVDDDHISTANIGRHLLGAESIGKQKAEAIALRVNCAYPASVVTPYTMSAEHWVKNHSLSGVDVVLDLTGEPDVRWHIDKARKDHPCPLLIGWMEPYAAAAHVCLLPAETLWMQGTGDLLTELEAVTWPEDVIRREPGCSSVFQSYTAAAATHAVALVTENALDLIDGAEGSEAPRVVSWIRGQRYLNKHWPDLELRDWAKLASTHDGLILTRPFP